MIQWYNILVKKKIIKFDKQIVKKSESDKKDNSKPTKKEK